MLKKLKAVAKWFNDLTTVGDYKIRFSLIFPKNRNHRWLEEQEKKENKERRKKGV